MRPLSICIVSHNAFGALTGGRAGHIGGVEWQTTLTARWLAARGHAVSMLTWDEGGPPEERLDGIRVVKVCRRRAGWPGLRFFHPKWTGLVVAMRRAAAEVYYHNCAECVTGQIALWCQRNRRGFVFSSANDTDCDPRLPELRSWRERVLYCYGLRHADRIIVQTETQRRMLREGFGLEALEIPMPCPASPMGEEVSGPSGGRPRVLWIARIARQKRPDRFLDLAELCPDLSFDFVGPSAGDEYAEAVCRRARGIPNVTVHGPVARERLGEFYRQALCFCSTSDYEGFPNTFIEAWSYGLPVISTFDPDGRIARRQLGAVVPDMPAMKHAIESLLGSPGEYRQLRRNAREYYLQTHTPEQVLPRFETVFGEVARRLDAGRPALEAQA